MSISKTTLIIQLLVVFCLGFFGGLLADNNKCDIKEPPQRAATVNKKNKALFELATKPDMGDKHGRFELWDGGIFMHPGKTTPTRVSFKLGRAYRKLAIRSFIATLPDKANGIPDAGTVGIEFSLDNTSNEKLTITRDIRRDTKQIQTFDVSNVDTLTISVDNYDGNPLFDWLILDVVDLK